MSRPQSLTGNRPIFVDRDGKRRKWFTALGAAGGTLLVTALGVLIAGLFGAGPGRLPGLPGLAPQQNGAGVAPTADPTSSAEITTPGTVTTTAAAPQTTPAPTATKRTGKPTAGPTRPAPPSKRN